MTKASRRVFDAATTTSLIHPWRRRAEESDSAVETPSILPRWSQSLEPSIPPWLPLWLDHDDAKLESFWLVRDYLFNQT